MIPFRIKKAREHLESFRRYEELYRSRFGIEKSREAEAELTELVEDFGPMLTGGWRSARDSILEATEGAVLWANDPAPPPTDALQEARAALESLADEWAALWRSIACWVGLEWDHSHYASRTKQLSTLADATSRQVRSMLAADWPVDGPVQEQEALSEIRAGAFVGLEEAFSQIAGVSQARWLEQVEEHRRRHPSGEA